MLETAEHTVVVRRKVSEWLLISLDAIKSSWLTDNAVYLCRNVVYAAAFCVVVCWSWLPLFCWEWELVWECILFIMEAKREASITAREFSHQRRVLYPM
jgi:hypothetical protein